MEGAAQGTTCSGGVCDSGSCVECISHGDCPGGACVDSVCVECVDDQPESDDVDTGCTTGAPQCLTTTNGPVCAGCANDTECDDPAECRASSCVGGFCQVANAPPGTSCSAGVCNAGQCVECIEGGDECDPLFCDAGSCVQCLADGDCDGGFCSNGTCVECLTSSHCIDQNECTDDACLAGACTNEPADAGSPCSVGVCSADTVPQCVACVDAGDCDDGIDCTADSCVRNNCVFTPDDNACDGSGDACSATRCTRNSGCQTLSIAEEVVFIDREVNDGSFELGFETPWQVASGGKEEVLVNVVNNREGATNPFDGKWFVWLGGEAAGQASVSQFLSLPAGTTTLQLLAATSFQTVTSDNNDFLFVELIDPQGRFSLPLATFSAKDALAQGDEWTEKGIAIQADVSEFAGMDRLQLVFRSQNDQGLQTDFLLDDIQVSIIVCEQ